MTLESRRDLAENGTLQKNTPLQSGIYFPRPQDEYRISLRFGRKRYASKKITPYEAEFIFRGLRMSIESRRDLAENGTLQKNNPLRSGIYFLRPQEEYRISSRFGRKRYASKNNPLRSGIYFPGHQLGKGCRRLIFFAHFS